MQYIIPTTPNADLYDFYPLLYGTQPPPLKFKVTKNKD